MPDGPRFASDYTPEHVALVKSTCLYLATTLGDLMNEIVIVGGLVPVLLIDQNDLPEGAEAHVGTADLDVGLSVAILDAERYQAVRERLRDAGFRPDMNESGQITRQRWKYDDGRQRITIDFLIPPTLPNDRGGTLRDLDVDFAAVITPGLHLAFADRQLVTLSGNTVRGEYATREISVCGPGAYVLLKAIAFDRRGRSKDAYDLFYLIRNYGAGPSDVASVCRPLLTEPDAIEAQRILERDFQRPDGVGPMRVAEFLGDINNDGIRGDVVAFLGVFLEGLREGS